MVKRHAGAAPKPAVAFRNGQFENIEPPEWWPNSFDAIDEMEMDKLFETLHMGAMGGPSLHRHTESAATFALLRMDNFLLPVLLPSDLDVAKFWAAHIQPEDLADTYGALAQQLEESLPVIDELVEALRSQSRGTDWGQDDGEPFDDDPDDDIEIDLDAADFVRSLLREARTTPPPNWCQPDIKKKDLARLIAEHRWAVLSTTHGTDGPTLACTIGMTALCGEAELLIVGFAPLFMAGLLNAACQAVLESGARIVDGASMAGLIPGEHHVAFREIQWERVAMSLPALGRHVERPRVVQLVLPDSNGLFPWQPGCHPESIHFQDVLSRSFDA
jgi:Domain of unknown function (DUF4262)